MNVKKMAAVLSMVILFHFISAESINVYGIWMEEETYSEYKSGGDELLVPYIAHLDGQAFLTVPNCVYISRTEQTIKAPGAFLKIRKISGNEIYVVAQGEKGIGVFSINRLSPFSVVLTVKETDSDFEENQWYFSKGMKLNLHLCDFAEEE